jgi:uncharacterized protein (TIGR03435 family)
MAVFAGQMPLFAKVNQRFVDATHIDGAYDFDFRWTPAPPQSGPGSKSVELRFKGAIFDSLKNQVGLQVEERNSPVEIIVVDHMNKVPVEN